MTTPETDQAKLAGISVTANSSQQEGLRLTIIRQNSNGDESTYETNNPLVAIPIVFGITSELGISLALLSMAILLPLLIGLSLSVLF